AVRQVDAGQVVQVAVRLHELARDLGPPRPDRDARPAVGEDLRERRAPGSGTEHGHAPRLGALVQTHPPILPHAHAAAVRLAASIAWMPWAHGRMRYVAGSS